MGLTLRAAQPAKVTRLLRSFGDLLVLLFAILVGVLTALSTLYFGKNFGSPEDYLGVFLAGAASQLLVGGLADMLSQMRTVDHASATATAPAAARIETTSAG
jgi:hypothetical protein